MPELTPLQALIHGRRSIRRWLPTPVERDKIEICLDSARRAPSASNVQPWRFLVIDDPEVKARFEEKAFSGIYSATRFAGQAPVHILILARCDRVATRLGGALQGVRYHLVDIGIAGEHLVLQAEELGLRTCWIGWFDVRKTRRFFRIPRSYAIVALVAAGYSDKRPPRERPLKPRDEVVWFNRFGG